ncbi:ABC-type oligopeptide transport system, periplasmic component [Candidatus Hepatincolaceae symbiont of Richtersius coronifer]
MPFSICRPVEILKNAANLFIILSFLLISSINLLFANPNKDTIRIAVMGEPNSLDPNYATGVWERNIINDIFSGLVEIGPKGDTMPAMAKSWDVSKDGKVYTFYLRDSKWSDGVPVTAQDFEYSYQRILNPTTGASYGSLLYMIKGAEAFNTNKGKVEDLGLKVINDKTLQITLNNPIAYFISALSHYAFFPVPKHLVLKKDKQWSKVENIVNNGAYKLTDWSPYSSIKAVKNEHFWDAANTKIQNIIYYTQEDRSAVLKRFRSGEIDTVADFSSDQYDWLMKNMKDQVYVSPYIAIYYYAINLKPRDKNKALNKNVRTALAMAVDREFIVEKILKSGEIPAYSFVPNGINEYVPPTFAWKNLTMEQRIEKAKELLKAEGYDASNPLNIELVYNTSENHKKLIIAVASMWKRMGVNATALNTEISVHYKNLQSGEYQVGRAGWTADYADAASILYVAESGIVNNYAQYSNKDFDKYLLEAKSTLDLNKRNMLYSKAETLLLEDVPYIPLYFIVSKNLISKRVKGWSVNSRDEHLTRFLSLSE